MRILAAFVVACVLAAPAGAEESTMSGAASSGITVTTVYDNYVVDESLQPGWGFSAVIATPGSAVLFDTGADGETLLANMAQMGIDPLGIDRVVISHSHHDHTGGLRRFLDGHRGMVVYFPASPPEDLRRAVAAVEGECREVSAPVEVREGVHATGAVEKSIREQALVVETGEGLVVITGCAHPGIVRTLQRVRSLWPDDAIALAMGGFHLLSAPPCEIERIIGELRALGVRRVAPSHCSGELARRLFREAYGDDYIDGGAGRILRFAAPGAAEPPPRGPAEAGPRRSGS